MRKHFDVVVIGGGPSGAITAFCLAQAGVRTAVVDGAKFPREKTCGGGLQVRALPTIPFDVSSQLRGTLRRASFSMGLGEPWLRTHPDPLVHGVLRTEFDAFLLAAAQRMGASIYEGTRVLGIEECAGSVVVRTQAGGFTAGTVVGADGANSVVARHLNEHENYFWQAAVSCEVPADLLNPGCIDRGCMKIDWGTLPSGYAWVFPKDSSANIGAGGPVALAKLLKPYVSRFLGRTRVVKDSSIPQLVFKGHHLPTLTRRTCVARGRVVLVGDAAGLVEPLTGDGISFACASARYAADTIAQFLEGRTPLESYAETLWREIGSELLLARKVLALSVAFPRAVQRLFQTNDRVWRTFCRILRGEESFNTLKADLLGPLKYVSKVVDLITHGRERMAIRPGAVSGLVREFSTQPL